MNAIWCDEGTGWMLKSPTGFPDEAKLHGLVEEAPQLLPLAGSPALVVLGREVRCGTGYADLVAVEADGRLVLIEVKLAANPEARRAIVAQVLAYAASLRGLTVEELEREVLAGHLQRRGFTSVGEAVVGTVQDPSFDTVAFAGALSESLAEGRFRLVLVLDEVPAELVRLVGYLESITDVLAIDLVVVTAYTIGGARMLVPQRVSPERPILQASRPVHVSARTSNGATTKGSGDFLGTVEEAPAEQREGLKRLVEWAADLEKRGLASLFTTAGKGRMTLRPHIRGYDAGLVTVVNQGGPALWLWRSVFMARAPRGLEVVERLLAPLPVGQGTVVKDAGDELLAALTRAYAEAAVGRVG